MIQNLEEYHKHIAIAGFRNVKIEDIDGFFDLTRRRIGNAADFQLFDAKLIAGWQHLYFAALNALNIFKNKQNISNSLSMEALLFASAQRQIKKAVEMIGVNLESSQVAVLVLAETREKATATIEIISEIISGERDDNVLELIVEKIEDIKRLFNISDLELRSKLRKKGLEKEALTDLVIERSALLVTRR